ncbi:Cys-tRNA(Pro) deacylase [Pedomonas mirosovicensis]|uniref:Cys-tRNA(Pro) deacylase n=1 Tax=Pedomonas mirosovicensis TaxID=2908641 RepID=UPI00216922FE|nr:Cys-tRNA(Pro) deacylase [Pedomonas mirosovicensis]MCH8686442.1 Cys-tRNA(Pro) deacylase [Pedomonas mirosovicensis]
MAKSTPAVVTLQRAGADFTLHTYDYAPGNQRVGLQAAEALGVSPSEVYKTLMALVDGKPVCAIAPSDQEISLKRLASAAGGKAAQMMPVPDAERVTGYRVGGISPFGQRRAVPVFLEEGALRLPLIFLNGGQRGLQVRLDPREIVRILNATAAPLL